MVNMKDNKNLPKKKHIVLPFLSALLFPLVSFAYELLQPLPSGSGMMEEANLSQYLSWLYKFALTAAVFLAVLMVVIGGLQIVLGGASEAQQKAGRERIKMAVFGLILALSSYLILYVIDPQLVSKGFTLKPITIEQSQNQQQAAEDTEKPTTPTSVRASTIQNQPQIFLEWSPSTDDTGVAGYVVMKGLVEWATVRGTNYTFTGNPDTEYCFKVYAFDAAGNRSGLSNEACAKTGSSQGSRNNSNSNPSSSSPPPPPPPPMPANIF